MAGRSSLLARGDRGARGARLARRCARATSSPSPGELGAGKTTFVRGACRALGVTQPVTSPTFTIGHRYDGRVAVSHLDLYRFAGVSAAEWGDLEPYFDGAVVFVEWPEAGAGGAAARRASRVRLAAPRARRAGLIELESRETPCCRRFPDADRSPSTPRPTSRRARSSATARCSASARSRAVTRARGRRRAPAPTAARAPRELDALVVGTGPGQLHRPADGARDRARARVLARRPGRGRLDARRARRGRARARCR